MHQARLAGQARAESETPVIFEAANLLIMPAWLAMLLAPRHRFTPRLALYTPVALALTYAALVAPQMKQLLPLLAKPTLGEIAALLGTPAGATIAWLHFLAFDLLIGRWILLQSQDLPRWRTAPILVLTLLFGPLGWALHFLTKNVRRPLPGRRRGYILSGPASTFCTRNPGRGWSTTLMVYSWFRARLRKLVDCAEPA